MPATLESLPDELLLMVGQHVLGSTGLEIGLQCGSDGNHFAFLIDTPGSQGLRSMRASPVLCGPASEVFRKYDTLSVNLMHIRPDPGYNGTPFPPINIPERVVSDEVFKNFNHLDLTVPFQLCRGRNFGPDPHRPWWSHISLNFGPITDVLMSCNMRFSRPKNGGPWTCHFVSVEKVNPIEGWNFTTQALEQVKQHIQHFAPLLVCEGLNIEAKDSRVFDDHADTHNATSALTAYRLVMTLAHHMKDMNAASYSNPGTGPKLNVSSRRNWDWHVALACNNGYGTTFSMEHLVRTYYCDHDEATERITLPLRQVRESELLLALLFLFSCFLLSLHFVFYPYHGWESIIGLGPLN